mmetsp:Transcript_27475/g.78608  ORF Transcript_27475/g.78608 Transcript_27475/m.78608 type:complete len:321 (-) Transcript_27475:292-1254(-)
MPQRSHISEHLAPACRCSRGHSFWRGASAVIDRSAVADAVDEDVRPEVAQDVRGHIQEHVGRLNPKAIQQVTPRRIPMRRRSLGRALRPATVPTGCEQPSLDVASNAHPSLLVLDAKHHVDVALHDVHEAPGEGPRAAAVAEQGDERASARPPLHAQLAEHAGDVVERPVVELVRDGAGLLHGRPSILGVVHICPQHVVVVLDPGPATLQRPAQPWRLARKLKHAAEPSVQGRELAMQLRSLVEGREVPVSRLSRLRVDTHQQHLDTQNQHLQNGQRASRSNLSSAQPNEVVQSALSDSSRAAFVEVADSLTKVLQRGRS